MMIYFTDEDVAGAVRKPVHIPMKRKEEYLYAVVRMSRRSYGAVMICTELSTAMEAVDLGGDFLWEHSNDFIVIEAILPNMVYGMDPEVHEEELYWYVYDLETGRYVPIERPDVFAESFGFVCG
jgi:ATP-dependent RNA circularization protein (DNA/RNA ligase family)